MSGDFACSYSGKEVKNVSAKIAKIKPSQK